MHLPRFDTDNTCQHTAATVRRCLPADNRQSGVFPIHRCICRSRVAATTNSRYSPVLGRTSGGRYPQLLFFPSPSRFFHHFSTITFPRHSAKSPSADSKLFHPSSTSSIHFGPEETNLQNFPYSSASNHSPVLDGILLRCYPLCSPYSRSAACLQACLGSWVLCLFITASTRPLRLSAHKPLRRPDVD